MGAGVALDRRGTVPGRRLPAQPLFWLTLPFVVLVPLAFHAEAREIGSRVETEASWWRMEERIANTPGRVACETQALCYWAGKTFEIDFFLYGQRVATRHEAGALETALDEHRFGAIELDTPQSRRGRPGEVDNPILPIIDGRYRTVFAADNGRRLLEPMP